MLMLVFWLIALARMAVEMLLWHLPWLDALIESLLVVQVGLAGLYAFVGHYCVSGRLAGSLGSFTGGTFHREPGIAPLAFGVLGILCFWLHGSFWLATGIGAIVFWCGAAIVRLKEVRKHSAIRFNNIGTVVLMDIGMSVLLFGLLGAYLARG
ncbi:hypothetical protein KSF_080950 [Reticulibacter mediterranei]|uniref:Uncharacterized protein n=1 Tax=Reticulibacter mediterranei TaxID=2778369 RepID=A0A8J3N4C3_9CHLR|nr:DUF6790 family protein [Reticulibacter mediterranei]GHO98047.1 hypothetical protein KSF_080950 [Reticulibacter mediterranei]